jgi:hypothetical protein
MPSITLLLNFDAEILKTTFRNSSLNKRFPSQTSCHLASQTKTSCCRASSHLLRNASRHSALLSGATQRF